MASNPDQTTAITATYYPDAQKFSFDPAPPFTSDQPITQFVFNLQLGSDIPGEVSFNPDQPVIWSTPTTQPPRGFSVELVTPQQVTIYDENSNTHNPSGYKFQFSFSVIYNDEPPQTIDPTIINAQIPPTPVPQGHGHGEKGDHGVRREPAGRAV